MKRSMRSSVMAMTALCALAATTTEASATPLATCWAGEEYGSVQLVSICMDLNGGVCDGGTEYSSGFYLPWDAPDEVVHENCRRHVARFCDQLAQNGIYVRGINVQITGTVPGYGFYPLTPVRAYPKKALLVD